MALGAHGEKPRAAQQSKREDVSARFVRKPQRVDEWRAQRGPPQRDASAQRRRTQFNRLANVCAYLKCLQNDAVAHYLRETQQQQLTS